MPEYSETFDVVVVGSGAAGAMAALRAADQGLSVLIVEKERKFGGTSSVSGGVMWVPNHRLGGDAGDSREDALAYLHSVITVPVNERRLEAYVDQAPEMLAFLTGTGVPVQTGVWPDYFPDKPGARADCRPLAPRAALRLLAGTAGGLFVRSRAPSAGLFLSGAPGSFVDATDFDYYLPLGAAAPGAAGTKGNHT